MKITFVSNYINHHQIPFCDAMRRLTEGQFFFIQTEPMEQERVQMGWQPAELTYVKRYYEEPEVCKTLIMDSDVVIFGGCEDESYIEERLAAGKPVVRNSERLYKTGQWKAVSPRGLRKKYHDHTRYRKAPVYLLCAGAYVPSDFHIVCAYPNKMYCWGYFPETKYYDIEQLLAGKGYECLVAEGNISESQEAVTQKPYLLWAGRFIDWKHPELALEAARYLKEKGVDFHLDIIGGGPLEEQLKELVTGYGLEQQVSLLGFKTPAQVREYMEKADVYLFTSDRQEGWGAVANEAMNSGCSVVMNHMIGAAPYLIRQGQNGFVYEDGCKEMLFQRVEELVLDKQLRQQVGREAYRTITEVWNAERAAENLYQLLLQLSGQKVQGGSEANREKTQTEERFKTWAHPEGRGFYPCMPAPVISERRMFAYLTRKS